MHGVREALLDAQAERMNLPLKKIKLPASPSDDLYKAAMTTALNELKQNGITTAAFGDIFLEDLKAYREEQLKQIGMEAVFPLWKSGTTELVSLLEETGIQAMVVCVNEQHLGKEFLGRMVNRSFLNDLPDGVDPCGENGEFHTFTYDGPLFSSAVPIETGDKVLKVYEIDSERKEENGQYKF